MFVDFRHGGGVFVLVGVLNIKYFVVFATFKKNYMAFNTVCFICFCFGPLEKGGSGCLKSWEALSHYDMQPTVIKAFPFSLNLIVSHQI